MSDFVKGKNFCGVLWLSIEFGCKGCEMVLLGECGERKVIWVFGDGVGGGFEKVADESA